MLQTTQPINVLAETADALSAPYDLKPSSGQRRSGFVPAFARRLAR